MKITINDVRAKMEEMKDAGVSVHYLQKVPGGYWNISKDGRSIYGKTKAELYKNADAFLNEFKLEEENRALNKMLKNFGL